MELILVGLIVYPAYKLCKCAPKTTYDSVSSSPKTIKKVKKKELKTIYEYRNLSDYAYDEQTRYYDDNDDKYDIEFEHYYTSNGDIVFYNEDADYAYEY